MNTKTNLVRRKKSGSKFYEFNQNNSGGSFVFNRKNGITHYVLIEAHSKDEASARAQDIGIYYDGVSSGRDCGCCGDRWYEPYGNGEETPQIYGKPFRKYVKSKDSYLWMKKGFEVCVHYLNGSKRWA